MYSIEIKEQKTCFLRLLKMKLKNNFISEQTNNREFTNVEL